jgi:vanillate O-demethylase ferredoxin subunit
MHGLLQKLKFGWRLRRSDDRVAVVAQRRHEATDVLSFRLEARDDGLPPFVPGAHLDVELGNGLIRPYSICSDPEDASHYRIAVLLDEQSRGGSAHIHANWRVGTEIRISAPRNGFQLVESRARFHFIAGGIGITPLLPMIMRAKKNGYEFSCHYYARSMERAAFADQLGQLAGKARLFFHLRTGGKHKRLAVDKLLACIPPADYVYCCGPASLMDDVRAAGLGRPNGHLRFEHFQRADAVQDSVARPFEVLLARSGDIFTVPAEKSLLEVLEERGHQIACSCREGICGTCRVAYTEGEILHRDHALTAQEQRAVLASCVSRAHGHVVLDL